MELHFDGPTPSQTVGPFFHGFLPVDGRVAGPAARGDRITLILRLLDADGEPVSDGMIEIWQADSAGIYPHPEDARAADAAPDVRGAGRLETDEDGVCAFETVRPGRVPGPGGSLQAPHVMVSIFARGILNRIATRVYFDGDPANAEDPVLALVPESRRATLVAHPEPSAPSVWRVEIRLGGEGETVFFDV